MTRPPFVIPTIKGHELWPTITRTPAVVRIQIIPAPGMTPDEITATRLKAVKMIANAGGTIKQSYLAFRQGCDLSNLNYTSRMFMLATGIVGRYVQNGSQETLNIMVNASELIPQVPKEDKKAKTSVFVVVVFEWVNEGIIGDLGVGTVIHELDVALKVVKPKKFLPLYISQSGQSYNPIDGVPAFLKDGITLDINVGVATILYEPKLYFDAGAQQTTFELVSRWAVCFGANSPITVTVMTFSNPGNAFVPLRVLDTEQSQWTGRGSAQQTEQDLQRLGYGLLSKSVVRKSIDGSMYIYGYSDDILHYPLWASNSHWQRVANVTIAQSPDGDVVTSVERRSGTVSDNYTDTV